MKASTLPERYEYDRYGNIRSMPHLPLMRWDYRDQLQATSQQVRDDGGTPVMTYYVYDAHGQRVRKTTEGHADPEVTPQRAKERIYLGGFEVYREYNSDPGRSTLERTTVHVVDDQQRIALVEKRTQGIDKGKKELIHYLLGNHLDSVSLELDEEANIISYEEYTPYGSTSYQAVRNQTDTPKRYRYSGKERDDATGLYYYGARYYAPWLGRWTSPDPAGTVDVLNLYAFVGGNPIHFVDKQGLNRASSVRPHPQSKSGWNRPPDLSFESDSSALSKIGGTLKQIGRGIKRTPGKMLRGLKRTPSKIKRLWGKKGQAANALKEVPAKAKDAVDTFFYKDKASIGDKADRAAESLAASSLTHYLEDRQSRPEAPSAEMRETLHRERAGSSQEAKHALRMREILEHGKRKKGWQSLVEDHGYDQKIKDLNLGEHVDKSFWDRNLDVLEIGRELLHVPAGIVNPNLGPKEMRIHELAVATSLRAGLELNIAEAGVASNMSKLTSKLSPNPFKHMPGP